jgi:hypothetical protein
MDDETKRADQARKGSPYLNTAQAAHYLGVSERHLRRLRRRATGPLCRRHAHMVLYHVDDLRAWSQSRADESGRGPRS